MPETRAFEVRIHDAGTIVLDGATTADNLSDTSASAHGFVSQAHTVADDSLDDAASVHFAKTATDHIAMVALEYTGGTTELTYEAEINLNGGETDVSNSPDAPTRVVVEDWGDFWRVSVVGANNGTGNTTGTALAYPHVGTTLGTRDVSVTGDADVWGAQLEDGAFPSSYIATTTAAVTRSADSFEETFTSSPQAMTVYVKFVERGTSRDDGNRGLVFIGGPGAGDDPRLDIKVAGALRDRYEILHDNGTDTSVAIATETPDLGDVVEVAGRLHSDGHVSIRQSINGGPINSVDDTTSPALQASWSEETVTVNQRAGSAHGHNDFLALTISSGVKTMDEMRSLAASKSGDLYSYYPGDPVDTFSRASAASYRNENEALKTASSGHVRDRHHVTDEDGKQAGATRLEASRTNHLTQSEDFSHADWTTSNVTVTADAAAAPDDTSVDFTIPDSRLVSPPEFGGQVIRPLEGKADLLPYSVNVIDDDDWLTSRIFSGGVPTIIGRLAELRVSKDGGSFETVDIRRVSGFRGGMAPEYELELSEERWVGRRNTIFRSNRSLQLVPQMPSFDWYVLTGGEKTDPMASAEPGKVLSVIDDFVLIQSGGPRIAESFREATVDADVVDSPLARSKGGNFRRLRFEDSTSAHHPVVSFGSLDATTPEGVTGGDWVVAPEDTPPIMPNFWVYWEGHSWSVNDNVGAWRLWWPDGIKTSEQAPFLVGEAVGTDYSLSQFLADIYSGVYGGEALRFDHDAVGEIRDLGRSGGNWWVITSPVDRNEFLADLYRANFIVPFEGPEGGVAPRQYVPESLNAHEMYHFDATNVVDEVSVEVAGRELRNVLSLSHLQAANYSQVFSTPLRSLRRSTVSPEEATHSSQSTLESDYELERQQILRPLAAEDAMDEVADPLFDLVGDGAYVYTLMGVPEADAPTPGDPVIVDAASLQLPNPGDAARTGVRACVVVERRRAWSSGKTHFEYRLWDLGASLNTNVSHVDTDFHSDAHSDEAHLDVAHDDVSHSDSSHSDGHSDSSHADDHTDEHTDNPHGDHDDVQHTDHQDGVDPIEDHEDHSDETHFDLTHNDAHTDQHTDTSHSDSHSDSAHSDSPHSDTDHEDGSHADDHDDASHVDDPHSDIPHADAHDDIPHGDGHGDSAHGDTAHEDISHGDESHSDTHDDVAHEDVAHEDAGGEPPEVIHDDAPHEDVIHEDHFDETDPTTHTDVSHEDVTHDDTAAHSDTTHSDHPPSSGHDDVTHSDAAHADLHDDVPHNDLAA